MTQWKIYIWFVNNRAFEINKMNKGKEAGIKVQVVLIMKREYFKELKKSFNLFAALKRVQEI